MNLQGLLAECYRRLNFSATPQASVTTRLSDFLNDAHRRVLSMPGMEQLRDATMTFTSTINTSRVALPPHVAQIRVITDVTNSRRLKAMRRGDARTLDPGVTAHASVPDWYSPVGQEQVALQPAAATGLWVVSTSAADHGNVLVSGMTTGGYQYAANLPITALNGVTRVPLAGARTDVIQVTNFSLQVAAAGYVSLYTAATAGTELARIEPGRTATKYLIIELLPQPTVALTYTVDYTRMIPDFTPGGFDEPLLPEDFHYLLVIMACRREYGYADDKIRYQMMQLEEQQAIQAMRAFVLYPPDYRVRNDDPEHGSDGGSNLGGYFPSGRW